MRVRHQQVGVAETLRTPERWAGPPTRGEASAAAGAAQDTQIPTSSADTPNRVGFSLVSDRRQNIITAWEEPMATGSTEA